MVHKLKSNIKIVTEKSFDKIKALDEEFLRKLYFHTHDQIQKLLIEQIFILKDWTLVIEEKDIA